MNRILTAVYREIIANQKSETAFWVLVGFVPTLAAARLIVNFAPGIFLTVRSSHVHHFTYGIIILAVAGYLALVTPTRVKHWVAALYGIGLALAFDEFGMWLHLTDNYNLRLSQDALAVVLIFLISVVYLVDFARRAAKYLRR